MAPAVSVIVPAYLAAPYIAQALDSILAQTFTDYEIIVVNDGSPDTEALEQSLEPYRTRINYLQQENQGPSAARNTGIRAAQGKYIAPLDADDKWNPDHLSAQVAVLESDPCIALVYADARIFGDVPEAGRTVMELCPSSGEVTFERLVTRACTVHNCVCVCRRDALLRAGLIRSGVAPRRRYRPMAAHRRAGRPHRIPAAGSRKLPAQRRQPVRRTACPCVKRLSPCCRMLRATRNSPPRSAKSPHASAIWSAPPGTGERQTSRAGRG